MLEHGRIKRSEENHVNKTKESCKCIIAIIIIKTYNGCHDLIEKATIFDNVAVPFVKEMIKYVKISHKYNEKI